MERGESLHGFVLYKYTEPTLMGRKIQEMQDITIRTVGLVDCVRDLSPKTYWAWITVRYV